TAYSLVDRDSRNKRLQQLHNEKRKQPGIEVPRPGDQQHLLIIRLDLTSPPPPSPSIPSSHPSPPPLFSLAKSKDVLRNEVQKGLKRLCRLFEQIEIGKKKIDKLDKDGKIIRRRLEDFKFSATIGFGVGFFD